MNNLTNTHPKKIYIISDTHFNHSRIVTHFGFRPYNFNDLIIDQCNKILKEDDILINLGDVIWGNKEQLKTYLSQIPGKHILVKGNHDFKHSNTFFYDSGFSFVCNQITIGKYVLSHKPVPIKNDEINIHGHFHNMSQDHWEEDLKAILTPNHYLFSLEKTKYAPVNLDHAIPKHLVLKSLDVK
jgi:calcineurin-like phosphoesterase family protein